MISTTKVSVDAMAWSGKASRNYGDGIWITANGASKYIYVFIAVPKVQVGAELAVADLVLTSENGFAAQEFVIERITARWKEGRLTWSNRPGVTVTGAITVSGQTVAVNGKLTLPLASMLQAVLASGLTYFGVRIRKTGAGDARFYSSEHKSTSRRPILEWETNMLPEPPENLIPAGERVFSVARPQLSWLFRDPDSEDSQGQKRVIIATDPTVDANGMLTIGIVLDSGWIVDAEQSFAPTVDLADSTTFYWQVAVRDTRGKESAWSTVAETRRATKGVLTIQSPAGDVNETGPETIFRLTGRDLRSAQYELQEQLADGSWKRLWLSPNQPLSVVSGSDVSFEVPTGHIQEDITYRIVVTAWDVEAREDLPNDRAFYEVIRGPFEYVRYSGAGAPAPVIGLSIDTDPTEPGTKAIATFNRAVEPAFFALKRDGVFVNDRLDPIELAIGGGAYELNIYEGIPGSPHTWEVEAVELVGTIYAHSAGNATDIFTQFVEGIWLVVPRLDLECPMYGPASVDNKIAGDSVKHIRIGSRKSSRRSSGVRGYEGTMSGMLVDKPDLPVNEQVARWEELAGLDNSEDTRLIYHDRNYRVNYANVGVSETMVAEVFNVEFEFEQVGDFTFETVGKT